MTTWQFWLKPRVTTIKRRTKFYLSPLVSKLNLYSLVWIVLQVRKSFELTRVGQRIQRQRGIKSMSENILPPRKRAKTKEEKEQRRRQRILRNRKAAHVSREKKRKQVELLESYVLKLETNFLKLQKNFDKLSKQCDYSKFTNLKIEELEDMQALKEAVHGNLVSMNPSNETETENSFECNTLENKTNVLEESSNRNSFSNGGDYQEEESLLTKKGDLMKKSDDYLPNKNISVECLSPISMTSIPESPMGFKSRANDNGLSLLMNCLGEGLNYSKNSGSVLQYDSLVRNLAVISQPKILCSCH